MKIFTTIENYCVYLGCTALYLSAVKGHQDVTEYLINMGADVNKQASNGNSYIFSINWEKKRKKDSKKERRECVREIE